MAGITPHPVIGKLARHGIIPVLRLAQRSDAGKAVAVLRDAGFRTFEVTMSIPGATGLMADLATDPEILVGAGTVLTLEDAERSLDAGARYLVSPCLVEALPALCREAGAACILGALTPDEVKRAADLGADAIKVFPAASMGGASHLKALKSVFPDLTFIPTGGVNASNMLDYLQAGAACVGIGSELFNGNDLKEGRFDRITAQARNYLELLQRHHR